MPDEGTIKSDEGHCRKRGNMALGKACSKSAILQLLNVESELLVNACASSK